MPGHSEGTEGTEGPATRELSLKGQTHRQLAQDNRGHHGKCQAGNREHRTPGVDLERCCSGYANHGPCDMGDPDGHQKSHACALDQTPQESIHKSSAELNGVCIQRTALRGVLPRLRGSKPLCLKFGSGVSCKGVSIQYKLN